MIYIIYIIVGIWFCYHVDFLPFKENGRWNIGSCLLFTLGVVFWMAMVVTIFVGTIIEEAKRNQLF